MRIAWFTHRYAPCLGGAEGYGRALVRRFVAAGHAADVFTSDAHDLHYFSDPTRRRVDAPAVSTVDGATVHRLPVRHLPFQRYLGRALSYVPHWRTQCRWESFMPILPAIERVRGDYDAVFAVGFPFTVFALGALTTARAAGCPLVLTPFLHLATADPGDRVHRTYTRPHQRRLLREADLVITPTELEARTIAGWGVDRARLLVLPMAVEPAEVTGGDRDRARAALGLGPEVPLVGQLGALDPDKGTCDLVRAVEHLNASRPPADPVHLALAGARSPRFDAFLAERPADARPWLHVLGPIAPAAVPDFYAGLDVFAMPSRTDSFGIVFLEAWANARPVVAAAAGGVVEVVRDEQDGLLVPFGAVPALAAALDRLVTDPTLARRLALAGQARALAPDAGWDARFATLLARLATLPTRPAS